MGEQRVISEAQASRCLHPEAVGKRWGDPISLVRQTELQARLDAWNAQGTEHGDSKGPYEGLRLSGADVSWLVDQSGFERDGAPNLHLEGANLKGTHLEGANLSSAHLEGANLEKTYLVGSTFNGAHLEGSNLFGAFVEQAKFYRANMMGVQLDFASLERTTLTEAHLEYARLVNAHLEGADLEGTNLERANLDFAHLEGADLSNANLRSACFTEARLEGVNLEGAVLESADLTQSWLDRRTVLTDAVMDRMTKLGDIQRGGVGVVNLTRIGWERILTLGDEYGVGLRSPIRDHTSAVRAYRQLAAQLRAQGLNDVADRFSHRAQIRQRLAYLRTLIEDARRPWRWPGDILRYFGSAALALLAGYGYRPGHTIILYLLFISAFAAAYFAYGSGCPINGPQDLLLILAQQVPHTNVCSAHQMSWNEALVVSFTAFHGRGLLAANIKPSDPQAALAAAEAVLGLIIEISFIATFTQRFFGAK